MFFFWFLLQSDVVKISKSDEQDEQQEIDIFF